MTYNAAAVSDTAIAHKKGISLQQGRALRDNLIAVVGGETDSPYVEQAWHPYDGVTVGDGNDGVIYDFAEDGAATTIETPNFTDGYEYAITLEGVRGGSGDLSIGLYRATSAGYATNSATIASFTSLIYVTGHIIIHAPRQALRAHIVTAEAAAGTAADATAPVTPFASATFHATAQKIGKARIVATDPLASGSKIRLLRRIDPLA